MAIASDYLRKQIALLKSYYPDKAEYIESALQEYLREDGPVADDEFYFLLKGRLETGLPKSSKANGHQIPRRTQRRRSSRR
jgi:hypothetical protein